MELSAGLLFPYDVSDLAVGRKYFQAVHSRAANLMPDKYGNDDLPFVFSYESLEQILADSWKDMFLWKSKKSRTQGIWGMSRMRHSSLFYYGPQRRIDVETFLDLYKELSTTLAPLDFGYIHALTQSEWQCYMSYAYEMLTPFNSGITSFNLRQVIPNLAWGTLFGQPYIDLIGAERILTSPAWKVEQWSKHLVYIQVTENLNEIESDYSYFNECRVAIKKHLGEQFFFSPEGKGVHPEFSFS